MKRILCSYFYVSVVCIFLSLSFITCKKSSKTDTPNSFSFVYDGTTYTTVHDTAYQYSPDLVIETAIPNCPIYNANFYLISSSVGSYTLYNGSGNTTQYVDNLGNPWQIISGTVNISGNSNNLLSGNFNVTIKDLSNVTHTTSGNFINMSIVP